MKDGTRSSLLIVLTMALAAGCAEAGGAVSVTRALAGRYGEDAFDLSVSESNGGTTVEVTLEGVDPSANEAAQAREVAEIVRDAYPLRGDRDSILVRLSSGASGRVVRTEWTAVHRFAASDLAGEIETAP